MAPDGSHEARGDGPEPDPRVSYANERTHLAWLRTSLGLMTAGLAVTQLLPPFQFAGGRRSIGLPLIALGIWAAAASYRQWSANEQAIRAGTPIPKSHLVPVVTAVLVVITLLALVLAAFSGSTK